MTFPAPCSTQTHERFSDAFDRPCILIVDDDPIVRAFLQIAAEQGGFICHAVEDGAQALDSMLGLRFDIAVVDIFMPVKEGISTIIEMRGRDPRMKILAISGGGRHFARGDMLKYALELGAHEALAKPFSTTVFMELIDALIGRRVEHEA